MNGQDSSWGVMITRLYVPLKHKIVDSSEVCVQIIFLSANSHYQEVYTKVMDVLVPFMPAECKKLLFWKKDLNKHHEVCQVRSFLVLTMIFILLQECDRPEQGAYLMYAGPEDFNSDQAFTEAWAKCLEYPQNAFLMNIFDTTSEPNSSKRCQHGYLKFRNNDHVLFPDCLVVSASNYSSKLIANANRHNFSIGR